MGLRVGHTCAPGPARTPAPPAARRALGATALVLLGMASAGCATRGDPAAHPHGVPPREHTLPHERSRMPPDAELPPERSLEVKASAYTSHADQTSTEPWVAAWGDRLTPDTKAIAVSRDLIGLGLTRGVRVRIDGLPGEYVVLDKMAKRWRRKIDIYMGEDVQAARRWGVRDVRIRWHPPPESEP